MPEMIPMPSSQPPGEAPPEMSRQLSPNEERDVLLNFMGNMYGEAKKWITISLAKPQPYKEVKVKR